MTPDIGIMRDEVSKMYQGDRWKRRVKKMPDSQVTAIYLKRQANIAQATAKKTKKKQEPDIPF